MNEKKKNLLVVDDNPAVCWLVADIFKTTEFNVFEARNGVEALMLLGAPGNKIDVLLVDVIMPTLNGTELARVVLAYHPKIKIIFMSGHPDDILAYYGIQQSRMTFMKKPFTADVLQHVIRKELMH